MRRPPVPDVTTFAGFSPERLRELLRQFTELRIGVVGDFFLDKYLDVDPTLVELSLETGKVAHQVVRVRHSPGAAGTVVSNLAALGVGTIFCLGIIGDDGEGYELRQDLTALGCDITQLHRRSDRLTPTYFKPRDVTDPSLAGEHSRYDIKNRVVTPPDLVEKVLVSLDALLPRLEALIVLDQVEEEDCGVVTGAVRDFLARRAENHPGLVFWADSRKRIRHFRRLHLKCNQFELTGIKPGESGQIPWPRLVSALQEFRAVNQAPVVVTLGEAGMLVSDPALTWVPAVRVTGPVDPTGAGDSATAGAVSALACGASLPEAALVGNLVASITVQQLATTGTARPEELPARLELWLQQQAENRP